MFANIVSLKIRPEGRERFLAAAEENSRGAREDEPGCLRFDVLQDAEDPHRFYLYEVFMDEAAFDAHFDTPHYRVWAEAVEAGVLEDRLVMRCETLFPADGAWR